MIKKARNTLVSLKNGMLRNTKVYINFIVRKDRRDIPAFEYLPPPVTSKRKWKNILLE